MSSDPLVLLPPSQAKTPGGRGRFSIRSGRFRRLAPAREVLIEALADLFGEYEPTAPNRRRIGPEGVGKVLGAGGALLEHALAVTARLIDGTAPVMPTVARYQGVVWTHLDPSRLDPDHQVRLLVPSAVVGLSTGIDPVPDHRLTFGVSLPGLGRLDRWWRPHLTDAVIRLANGSTVVDLLPNEHAAAIDLDSLAAKSELVRVRFVAADGRRATGHGAKAVKGRVARVVLTDGTDALNRFAWEGWRATATPDGYDVIAP